MSFGDFDRGYGQSTGGYQQPTPYQPSGRGGDQEYIQLSENITKGIQQIQTNVATINKLVSQLGTPKDTLEVRDKLHDVSEETKEVVKEVGKDLKLLGKLDGGSPIEARSRRMQQQKLSTNFKEALERFQQQQRLAQQKEREYVMNAKRVQSNKQEILSRKEEEEAAEETRNLVQDDQRHQQLLALENEIENNEAIIAEREEGIKGLEESIRVVNEIFIDLGVIVNEQQKLVDTIENNVETAVVHTKEATKEITVASDYQKSARTKMCCILAIFVVIISIIIIVVVLKFV